MAVVIRLARFGAVHTPKYRVQVADSRYARNGRFIETVGHYNPNPQGKEKGLHLDLPKIESWVKKGARPTERVSQLIRTAASTEKA
jgi:small subunit ribosomal protein S16